MENGTSKCCGRNHPQPGCNCCACVQALDEGRIAATETDKATPRPWRLGTTDNVLTIYGPDDEPVVIEPCDVDTYTDCRDGIMKSAQLDGQGDKDKLAMIVKMLNAHDDLVAVCEDLTAQVAYLREHLSSK